jgi:hypothetical protein
MSQPQGGVVLLDIGPGPDGEFDRSMLERLGHPVTVCSGPEEHALCPLVGGHGCQQYEEAHGIVFALDLERPEHRAILRSYRDMGPAELPIRVVCTPEQVGRFADVLRDVEVWDHEPTVADLDGFAAEVEAADRWG